MRIALFSLAALILASLAYALTPEASFDPTRIAHAYTGCLADTARAPFDACLRHETDALLEETDSATLMSYIIATSTDPAITTKCHEIAHAIGTETYRRNGSLESSLERCTPECGSGCIHGVIAARIAEENGFEYLSEELTHLDEASLRETGRRYCAMGDAVCHTVGHVARITTPALESALTLCDDVAPDSSRMHCYNGVFMEDAGRIAFVRTPDFTIANNDDFGFPCSSLPEKYLRACFMRLKDYQRTIFKVQRTDETMQRTIADSLCGTYDGVRRYECFYGRGYGMDRFAGPDGSPTHDGPAVCDALSASDREACTRGLAFNYASISRYNDMITFCDSQSDALRTICYDESFDMLAAPLEHADKLCSDAGSSECTAQLARYRATR